MTDHELQQAGRLDMDSPQEPIGDYLCAHKWEPIKGRKTSIWSIFIKARCQYIGKVAWFSSWRRFVFFAHTDQDLLFDALCLRSIADFCDKAKAERQKKK